MNDTKISKIMMTLFAVVLCFGHVGLAELLAEKTSSSPTATLSATGGMTSSTRSVASGGLPDGLNLSSGKVAGDAPPLTSSITVAKTTVNESSTFIVNMLVTNTGSATVTGVRPSSLDVNGTGWAALFKWPSLASASITPGKTVKFSMTYKAMLAGTVLLSGNATSADGNSAVSSSPLITILPKKISTVAVTDDLGSATLKSGKVTLPIQFQDEDTGSPIVGLSAALALDKKNRSRAVLAIADPLGRYPLQVLVLQGPSTIGVSSAKTCMAVPKLKDANPVLTVSSRPDCSPDNLYAHVILPIETSALPPLKSPPPPPTPLSDTMLSATKAAMSSMMQQALKATVSKTTISCQDALEEDKNTLMELPVDTMVSRFIIDPAATAACILVAPEFALACPVIVEAVGLAGDMYTAMNLARDVFQCGLYPSDELILKRVTLLPGSADILLYQELVSPQQTAPQLVQVPVSATDSYGQLLSTGSLELVSQANLGSGLRAVIDNGTAEVPVPLGDYGWTLRSQGFKPQCGQVSVTESGAVINAVMQPQPIASGTATADQLTGFLPEGTSFPVTPHFFDANGIEVSCSGEVKFYAHNPVGTSVATVDSDTGIVTMLGGCGAAGITAWCNGMKSRRLLVSTDCDGKLPATPPTVPGLPMGFPTDLPKGDYAMTYSVNINAITCCCCSPEQCTTTPGYSIAPPTYLVTIPLTNLKTFAKVLVETFNAAIVAVGVSPGCSQSVSYSPFTDDAFTVTYTLTCYSEGCTGGITTADFTMQKL
jgi:hypothetical protein